MPVFHLREAGMSDALLVLTTLPDAESAHGLATALVEARVAACVNLLPQCSSIYRWEGKVESASEVLLLIKTRADGYDALEAAIRSRHPYELPEIVAVPVVRGLPDYLRWVAAESAA